MVKFIFQILILNLNFIYLLCNNNLTLYFDFHLDKKISFTLFLFNSNKNGNKYNTDKFYFHGHIVDISKFLNDYIVISLHKLHPDSYYRQKFDSQFTQSKESSPKLLDQKKNKTNNNTVKKKSKPKYKTNYNYHNTVLFLSSIEYLIEIPLNKELRKFTLIVPYSLKPIIAITNIIFNNTVFFLAPKDEKKFKYYINSISNSSYYITIGKDFDDNVSLKLECICFLLFLVLIMLFHKRRLKGVRRENKLPIHYLLSILIGILISLIISLNFCMDYLFDFKYYYLLDYLNIFVYSIYKGMVYSVIISLLNGWLILKFNNFSKITFIVIFIYNFILSIIFSNIVYYFSFYDKQTLFFMKNILSYLVILFWVCKSFITIFLEMNKQIVYEKKIKSNLIQCYKYKRKKLFLVYLYAILYCIIFVVEYIFGNNKLKQYVNGFLLFTAYQLIVEIIFLILLCFLFFPARLPKYYLRDVIFNYIEKKFLLARIGEDNIKNLEELQHSLLNKKKEFIVFIEPFNGKEKEMWRNMKLGYVMDVR